MEAELREIVDSALLPKGEDEGIGLGTLIHRRFAAIGGFEMPDIPREPPREPPDFTE